MYRSDPITPGEFYDLTFDLQAKDMVIPAGRRLAFMILSSDFEHTLRPAPGTADGRHRALERHAADRRRPGRVRGGDRRRARRSAGGRQRARDALAHARRAGELRRVHTGAGEGVHGDDDGQRGIEAGDATLSVSEPGHLMNRTFALPEPLPVEMAPARGLRRCPTRPSRSRSRRR
jgi:hypothetical protein